MITIFSKKRTTKDGKDFNTFMTRLTKKDGSNVVVSVMFPRDNQPKSVDCPLNIEVPKGMMNLSTKTITDDITGATNEYSTLWVKAWELSSTPYVDTSLDGFNV